MLLEYSLDLIHSSPPPTAVQTYLVGRNNPDVIHSTTDLLGPPIKGHPEPRSSPTPLHPHLQKSASSPLIHHVIVSVLQFDNRSPLRRSRQHGRMGVIT